MVYIIKTINGVKKKIKVAGFLTGGNPVGSMLTTFKKVNPTNYLYCDGSTFDENQYPALYLYLGTNVLPDYRECVMVGAEKNTTDIFDSTETDPSTGQAGTQNHDVFSQGEFKDDQLQGHYHRTPQYYEYAYGANTSTGGREQNFTGRYANTEGVLGARTGTTTRTKEKAVFVYIKAVDGVDIADEDYFLNTVKNFVEEKNSYSTEETLTGGKWIDGKPIYRKVFSGTVPSTTMTSVLDTTSMNVDTVISIYGVAFYNNTQQLSIPNRFMSFEKNSPTSNCIGMASDVWNGNPFTCVIEYTKTTD